MKVIALINLKINSEKIKQRTIFHSFSLWKIEAMVE